MQRWWRVVIWGGGAVLSLAGIAAILAFAMFQKFYPTPPKAEYPPAHDTAMAQRQDLDTFRLYLKYNRAYTPAAREQALQMLRLADAKAGTMNHAQLELTISRMVALSDNGHSTIFVGSLSRHNNRLPCRLYRFADGFYVIRAHGPCVPLLGAKLIAIDGQSVDRVADGMYRYSMGPRNHYDQFKSVAFLESPELLHAAEYAYAPDRLTLTILARDGLRREVGMMADPPDPNAPHVYSDAYLSPEPIAGEAKDWQPLLSRHASVPLFLRDYGNPFHTQYWPDRNIYYVQFRANSDDNGHSISDFVWRVKNELAENKPRVVVLDLRLDQGGNLVSTADLMKKIPYAEGVRRVYLLTSAWTFSAGLVSAAIVKGTEPDKVTVIGENVGDRLRFWAEGGSITLPNLKLDIGFATGLHDYRQSCWDQSGCFWLQLFIHPRPGTLEPDVVVPYRFADYVEGRDPILATALSQAAATR